MASNFIPICEPCLIGNEKKYVVSAIEQNSISSIGKYVEEFENSFAAFCGTKHAIATTSGTTAIHLALAALGVGKGDEVILPSFTMIATALPVIYAGATPVFVDCLPDTWCIDPDKIAEKITSNTKVILPVHIYGHLCDMEAINGLARKHGITVVEDAAESHGAEFHGRRAGSFGQIGCFSFYANKIITTGEGGMVVTDDDSLAERCRSLKNLAFLPDSARRFEHHEIGFNYRMTNLQAAVGLAQMENVDVLIERRRQNAAHYSELLQSMPGSTFQIESRGYRNIYWMFGLLMPKKSNIDVCEISRLLLERGIDTRRFFLPLHKQPVFNRMKLAASCPVSDDLHDRGLLLPSGGGLTEGQIKFVAHAVKSMLGGEK